MRKFKKRIDQLEVRSCDNQLMNWAAHTRAEIVKWDTRGEEERCATIAYWQPDDEGFDLKFVGARPFSAVTTADEVETFWLLAQYGQKQLSK